MYRCTHSTFATFSFFITDEMVELIVEATNQRGTSLYGEDWKAVDNIEMMAWIGLHLRAGVDNDNFTPVNKLYSTKTGPQIYRACISRNRFKMLKRCTRFEDILTREFRKAGEQGKLAPIHEVWQKFIEACQVNYKASSCVTVDESLLSFRGRCSFKVYMPSKPSKYGINVWSMVDSTNSYLLNAQIYTGKGPGGPEKYQAKRIVRDLTTVILNSGRNVTCDNFFTDVHLAIEFLSKNVTMIGTLRKNKREIPSCFQASHRREWLSTKFGFSKEHHLMMCSYVPKVNKAVILLSTMHYDNKVQESTPFKPDVILDYNATKGGVDTLDQLVKNYTCKRITKRWPMIIFYWMIDVAGYNSAVCFMEKQPHVYKGNQKRRNFLSDLSEELCKPQIERRFLAERKKLPKHVVVCMEAFVNKPMEELPQSQPPETRKRRCKKCPRKLDKKTRKSCVQCSEPIFDAHSKVICNDCAEIPE